MNKIILHLQTWGTITWNVPEYKEIERIAHIFTDYVDIWKYIIYSFQAPCEYSMIKICDKDSRQIVEWDRIKLLEEISWAYKNWVKDFLITHGTYTMPDTAKYIFEKLPKEILNDISVVITWSMYPWGVLWSDAPMNIWAAISTLLNSKSPIWVTISMHGKNWDIYKIEKDIENLVFYD